MAQAYSMNSVAMMQGMMPGMGMFHPQAAQMAMFHGQMNLMQQRMMQQAAQTWGNNWPAQGNAASSSSDSDDDSSDSSAEAQRQQVAPPGGFVDWGGAAGSAAGSQAPTPDEWHPLGSGHLKQNFSEASGGRSSSTWESRVSDEGQGQTAGRRQQAKNAVENIIRNYKLNHQVAWQLRALNPDKQKMVMKLEPELADKADPSEFILMKLQVQEPAISQGSRMSTLPMAADSHYR